jgi:hypothetical protein
MSESAAQNPIQIVFVQATDVLLEVVTGHNRVGFEEDTNEVIKGGTTVNKLREVLVKLSMNLVDIPVDSSSISPQVVQVVSKSLSGSSIVDGGKPHDDLVHEGCVLNAVEGVLFAIGEQTHRCVSGK